ncbi:UNVERIFIED_CONTAM: hypothetical protein RMT77_015104 [Armadillidium vulgare]
MAPLAKCLSKLLEEGEVMPEWMTIGDTNLIPKSKETKNSANYRPITCLPTMYKTLTAIIASRIYSHIENNNIINEEQKGCIRNSLGTKDQLLINKMILENSWKNQKHLSMAWIDYKKAYDSVPHSWILEVLKIYKVSEKIVNFIKEGMKQWRVNLKLKHEKGAIEINKINIKRGIFQGDSLSPLLFILAINPLSILINNLQNGYRVNPRSEKSPKIISHLFYMDDLKLYAPNRQEITKQIEVVKKFSKDICMEFGLEKCAFLTLKKGRRIESENITIEEITIRQLEQEKTYKYLGVEESEKVEHKLMKEKLGKEYLKRTKAILRSELNAKNKIEAIKTLAIPVILYSSGIIDWFQDLNKLDIATRKMLNAHKMIYRGQILSRMYTERKEGGMGLVEIDCIYKREIIGLGQYLENTENKYLQWVHDHERIKPAISSLIKKKDDYLNMYQINVERSERWEEKTQKEKIRIVKDKFEEKRKAKHINQWKQQVIAKENKKIIDEVYIDKEKSVEIFCKGGLQAEEERMIRAAQDGLVRTRWRRKHIEKEDISDACRICQLHPETVPHILSACEILLNRGTYTDRHDTICKTIHFKLCKKYNITTEAQNYWKHNPPEIVENNQALILYDCPIPTDIRVTHNRPDIVIKDKTERKCYIIEVGVPFDNNLAAYEREKEIKYIRLKQEIRRMWDIDNISIIPIVVGAMGVIKKSLIEHLKRLPVSITSLELTKMVVKKSISILRLVLGGG